MKTVQLIAVGRPLEAREIPVPTPGADEVLIRVKAAGICHSDAHYRAGRSPAYPLPLTLGHEVAGVVEAVGTNVTGLATGKRVCVHYLATCGQCPYCLAGTEQFCRTAAMIGKHRHGGYAEFLAMPARSVFALPDDVSFEVGAILMCSAATALHALVKARLKPGDSVAVFGLGGLGMSAVQIARALGAGQVFGVDIQPGKLAMANSLGVVPVNASQSDAVDQIREATQGRGVDVSVEVIGLPLTMRQAVSCLAIQGRAALAGITEKPMELYPYQELLNKEAEIIGVSDHLAAEIPKLLQFVRQGNLNLTGAVTRKIPLEADGVNQTLNELERFGDSVRVVIVP